MTGGVEQSGARHFESILQRRVSLGLFFPDALDGRDVIIGVSRHVADTNGDSISHAYYAQLRDGVLFKIFTDKGLGVEEGQQVAGRSKVFFIHGQRHIEDEDEVADDASLERSGVFE